MAIIDIPDTVGIAVVSAVSSKPHAATPGLTGRVTPLGFGPTFLTGSAELVERSAAVQNGFSEVLAFITELEGPINTFELPLPDRITPWAAAASTANATSTAAGTGTITLATLPSPTPKVHQWVRIEDRCVCLTGVNETTKVLTFKPALEFETGDVVQWGQHTVHVRMQEDPQPLRWDSRTGFVSRVGFDWREVL